MLPASLNAIYIINLESDVERRRRMEVLVEKLGLDEMAGKIKIWKAYDGRLQKPPSSFRGNGPAYGCTRSHLAVLDEISDKNLENVLVMEDDLMVHKEFGDLWNKIVIPEDWQIIYLGATQICWKDISVDENSYRAKRTLGTTAYLIRNSQVAFSLKNSWTGQDPIDEHFVKLQDVNKAYVCFPNLFIQNVEESHIRQKDKKWTFEGVRKRLKWDLFSYEHR